MDIFSGDDKNKYPKYRFIIESLTHMRNIIKRSDLDKFIEKFEPSKFKMLSRGIEIRGIKDLNKSMTYANKLIEQEQLQLAVSHSAEMAMYGSFEVIYN